MLDGGTTLRGLNVAVGGRELAREIRRIRAQGDTKMAAQNKSFEWKKCDKMPEGENRATATFEKC
jgi:hypothetical protein